MGGIYRILNTINGKYYIGSTRDFKKRKGEHFHLLKKGKHKNSYLQGAVKKHGLDAFVFEELETLENLSREHLLFREQYYLDSLNKNLMYNLSFIANSGGSDLLCVPTYLIDLECNIIESFPSMTELRKFLNRGGIYKTDFNNGKVLCKKYRAVTADFYTSNTKLIDIWKEEHKHSLKEKLWESKKKISISLGVNQNDTILSFEDSIELCINYNIDEETKKRILLLEKKYLSALHNILKDKI